MENIYGLFQLSANRRHRGREDLLLSRRPQPRPPEHGADQVRTSENIFTNLPTLTTIVHSLMLLIFRRIMRPTDVPDQGLLCDLLWSDPDKDTMGWGENDRGVSFTFGAEVVAKFLHKHDFDLICRAHQVHD